MKRILSLVLILILSVAALTACEFPFPWGDDPSYDLDNAKGALVELYPKLAPTKENPVPNTVSNYDLTKVLPLKDGTYTVAWTTSNENVAIKDYVPADEKDVLSAENTVTVHVPQRPEIGEPDITYTLSALITAPNGTTAKVDFNLKVPAMAINTYDEYVNAKVGDFLTVEGIVNGINSKADGNKDDSVYFQDENGGYYAYQVNADVLATLEIGMKIRVSGERGDYSGTHELLNATIEIIDETPVPVTPLDYTDIILGAENLKVDELVYKQAVLVTIKGVTIAEPGDNGYYHFTIGGHKVYLRVSSSNNACSTADTAALIALHAANFGNKADVTGLVCLYNGAFYLMPTSADAFHNFVAPERTPAEKVEFESENLKVTDKVTENSTIALPLTGTVISDVVISWTIDNENFTIGEDGKLPIVLGNEEVTLKLTATFTCGEATATKDYEIKVAAASKMPYVHKPLSAPVVGTFKIAMNTTPANGKVLYFNGQLNDKGALMTTDRFEEAVDVIVEVLDAEAGTYSLKVGDKYLEGYLNGTYKNIRFADEPKAWKWNSDAKVFVCEIDGVSYYFGDRDRGGYANTTMALSDIKYITGDNLSKVGVSQFPGFLGTMAPAAYTSAPITTPGAGSFIIVMDTTPANGKPLYFNGELNSKGALMTTDKIENAVEVIVEVLDAEAGTYSLKVGDKYLEGYLNGTYKNIRFADEPKAWKWNADAKVFVCDIDGIDYYFGDRDRGGYANDTMALSDIKYITGDNLSKIGVSQFTGAFSTIEFVTEDGGETPEQPGEGGNQGGETPSAPTTAEEILNALYALSDGETLAGSFTLTGKITTLDSWNNPTIVIEGFDSKPVYCYKLKDDRFVVGATITVTATTLKNYQGTYELEGCTLVEITLPEGSDDNTDDDNTGSDVTTGNAYEYTFVSGVFTKDGTVALGNKNWTLTTVTSSGDAAYFGFDSQNGKGFQFGKAKDHLTSMTLVSESFTNVTKIVINTSGAKDVNGSFEVYVGDVKVGDSTTLTSSATDYTFECSTALTGEVKIVYTNSAKAIYIKSIQVVTAE